MVQNVVFVADDAVEQPFVGGSAQFFKRIPGSAHCDGWTLLRAVGRMYW